MTMSKEYVVRPAVNGGFVVTDRPNDPGRYIDVLGAFSNATDMIAWLAKEHGVPFGGFDVPADKVEVVKRAIIAKAGWTEHDGTDANPFYRLPRFEGKIEGDYGDGDTRLTGIVTDRPQCFSWAHVKRYRVIA